MSDKPQRKRPPKPKSPEVAYRAAIRVEWKKIVRRDRFTSYEYKLIDQWFAEGVETAVILQGIKAAVERAKQRSLPIFSIGFITSDIERIKRDRARMNVGGPPRSPASSAVESEFERLLDAAIDNAAFCPVMQENLRGLKRDLALYSSEHARHLYGEIVDEGCGLSKRSPSPHQTAHVRYYSPRVRGEQEEVKSDL